MRCAGAEAQVTVPHGWAPQPGSIPPGSPSAPHLAHGALSLAEPLPVTVPPNALGEGPEAQPSQPTQQLPSSRDRCPATGLPKPLPELPAQPCCHQTCGCVLGPLCELLPHEFCSAHAEGSLALLSWSTHWGQGQGCIGRTPGARARVRCCRPQGSVNGPPASRALLSFTACNSHLQLPVWAECL